MNFEDEPYVRVYRRRTTTMAVVGWAARAVLRELFLVVDRAGVLDLDDEDPADAVAAVVGDIPVEVIRDALERLVSKKCIMIFEKRLVIPNYQKAQECRQTDRLRQQESRERRRLAAMRGEQYVTERDTGAQPGDQTSPTVTDGHPVLSSAQQCSAMQGEGETAPAVPTPKPPRQISTGAKRFAESFATPAPDQIEFTPEHREFETHNGIDLQETWLHCRDYRRSKGYVSENWQAEFLAWLRKEARFRRERGNRAKQNEPPQPNDPANRYVPPRVIS